MPLCRVPKQRHKIHIYRVFFFLPSVFYLALGKDRLCRVRDKIHSAKPPALVKDTFFCFFYKIIVRGDHINTLVVSVNNIQEIIY